MCVNPNKFGCGILWKIIFAIIAAAYDYKLNIAAFLKADMCQKRLDDIKILVNINIGKPNILVEDNVSEESRELVTRHWL